MTFATALALLIAGLVIAPLAAHLFRRRHPKEEPFTAIKLVPASPPLARRRSAIEDKSLLVVRALLVLALAVLGSTPFLNCSHLALARKDGASVALVFVVDDSLSMQVQTDGATRFERAVDAAEELMGDTREGDSFAIVLAGKPPRLALAPTTNPSAARKALEELAVSDRATDLEGALRLAENLLSEAPQVDRRVVLLSDRADGTVDAEPLQTSEGISLWAPVDELAAATDDCAVVQADRTGSRVEARILCARADGKPAEGRELVLASGDEELDRQPLEAGLTDRVIALSTGDRGQGRLDVRLTGRDSIASDDAAPVVEAGDRVQIAVLSDQRSSGVETGGPPPVEQALAALDLGVSIRPIPTVPEHRDQLNDYAGLLVDDAPGFTPEVRRALDEWVADGGVLLLALGPRSASAPLGSGFAPLVPGVVRFSETDVEGVDAAKSAFFGPAAVTLSDIQPKGRATLSPEALGEMEPLAEFADGAPLLTRRRVGRGLILTFTLDLGTETSDFVLRPGFLAMLERFVELARTGGGARRLSVGEAWVFDGYREVVARYEPLSANPSPERAARELQPALEGTARRIVADRVGWYRFDLDGEERLAAASIAAEEIAFAPRALALKDEDGDLGGEESRYDISPFVALLVLGLIVLELGLRLRSGPRGRGEEHEAGANAA